MGFDLRSAMKNVGMILFVLPWMCTFSGVVQAADTLNIRFTPTDAGGSYGDKYVQAVWLTNTSGQRICTVGTGGGKVALWAYTRYSSVYTWYNNNPTYRDADRTDRTGATQTGYREYNISWDWKKYNTADSDGTVVPDGNYKLEFECSNGNGSAALNRATVAITKGRTAWVLTPPNGDFLNVRVEYTPSGLSVSNSGVTNVTSSSARLNGELTDTGGENPSIFVYWGKTDGGTTPGNWEHAVNLGVLGQGTFYTDISGLTSGTTYYYRCRAVNSLKDVWASATVSFDAVNAYTIFKKGDTWKYFKGYSTPTNWNGLGFADSSWLSGATGIGYGDSDDATVLSDMQNNYTTVYMRYSFMVDLLSDVTALTFTVDYDDGFVAFINGQEVTRRGVASGQNKDTSAADHEASAGSGGNPPETIDLSSHISKLVAGSNVFAIEVHNAGIGSSDLSMIPSLVMIGGMLPPRSDIQLNRNSLNFGQVDTGQTVSLNLNITNTGTLPLEIKSLSFTGLLADSFSIVSPVVLPVTIAPSGSQAVTVRYSPAGPGDCQYTYLVIGSNDPDESVVSVELRAESGPSALHSLRQAGSVGGVSRAVAGYGDKLLLAQGATLAVMDKSNPAKPVMLKQTRLSNRIEAIAVKNDIAYVAAGASGLLVVDLNVIPSIIDPLQYDTSGHAYDVACQGDRLCVADGLGGMQLYDVSVPGKPVLLGTYQTGGPARAVKISGTKAYVMDEKAMTVIPLETLPLAAQYVFKDIEFGLALEILENTAYISDTVGNLFVVDVSGPPVLQGKIRPQAGMVSGISIVDSHAYLAASGGLEVIDITSHSNPASLGVVPASGEPCDVISLGTSLYLAEGTGGLRVLSLANPAMPEEVGEYGNHALPVALAGTSSGEIYSAQGAAGLNTLNLSDALNPKQISLLGSLSNARDVAVHGAYACVARGQDGMQIVDISNPTSPVLKGSFPTEGFCSSVACLDNIVVFSDDRMIYAVNISQPDSPVLLNQWTSGGRIFDVATDGIYLFAAIGEKGVEIYKLDSAVVAGSYSTAGTAHGIALSGNTAYIACGLKGLQILNISYPSSPSLLGAFDTIGIAMDVALAGSRVCLAEAGFGITIVDASVPASPILYARSALPKNAIGILSADSRVFVADERGGLAVLAVTALPTNPVGDISGDWNVDIADLVSMANNWLAAETDLNVLHGNLFYYDTSVNLKDFSVLASQWQNTSDWMEGVKAYWKLDEISGTSAADSSGNGYHGTLMNMSDAAWVAGKRGNALSFDGSNDYVVIPNYKGVTGTAARSCGGWIKTTKLSGEIMTWGAVDAGTKWVVRINDNGTLRTEVSYGYLSGATVLTDNNWHHIAVVLADDGSPDVGEIQLYVDGRLEPIIEVSMRQINTVASQNVQLGAFASSPRYFLGLMDDIWIFDKALTAEQIQAIMTHK
ncbi:MAG TPA: choice-of-anchor D domain-containing protein [Anaerohalosphaeraceae bacterium]|nr:choice-of-anchor D domain-containing protein [Anaerohalosphaeraceae bacterium]